MPVWVFIVFMLWAAFAGFGLGYAVRQSEETERLVRAYENGPGHCTVDLDHLKGVR